MNGTQWKKNESKLTPAEQTKKTKLHQNIKLLICILISNLLVIIMTMPNWHDSPIEITDEIIKTRPGYSKLELPLILYVPIQGKKTETVASLYDSSLRPVVLKAYILSQEQKDDGNLFTEEKTSKKYVVEIPDSELSKIMKMNGTPLLAYPYIKKSVAISRQKKRNYEINF
ncbi:MAG: hypothetical protein KAQ98_04105 [Bacteriovoracaceae bacterium]|nr:hypothetical protein [Bacteriovoracaceae bacterium]